MELDVPQEFVVSYYLNLIQDLPDLDFSEVGRVKTALRRRCPIFKKAKSDLQQKIGRLVKRELERRQTEILCGPSTQEPLPSNEGTAREQSDLQPSSLQPSIPQPSSGSVPPNGGASQRSPSRVSSRPAIATSQAVQAQLQLQRLNDLPQGAMRDEYTHLKHIASQYSATAKLVDVEYFTLLWPKCAIPFSITIRHFDGRKLFSSLVNYNMSRERMLSIIDPWLAAATESKRHRTKQFEDIFLKNYGCRMTHGKTISEIRAAWAAKNILVTDIFISWSTSIDLKIVERIFKEDDGVVQPTNDKTHSVNVASLCFHMLYGIGRDAPAGAGGLGHIHSRICSPGLYDYRTSQDDTLALYHIIQKMLAVEE